MWHPKVLPYLFFHQNLPSLASNSSTNPIQDLLPHEKLSYWLCSTIPQGLLYPSFHYSYSRSTIPSRSTLRSSARGHLLAPRTRTSMTQRADEVNLMWTDAYGGVKD